MKATVVICLAVLATVTANIGINSYGNNWNYPLSGGNVWSTFGGRGSHLLKSGWNLGHRSGSYRYKRAALGYGPYVGNSFSGLLGRQSGQWGPNFGLSSGWRSNSFVNQYGY